MWSKREVLLIGLMILVVYNLFWSERNAHTTTRRQTTRRPLVPHTNDNATDVALLEGQMEFLVTPGKNISKPQHRFVPPDGLSKYDIYGAAWWQSVDRFMEADYTRMHNLEDGTFTTIYAAGNGSMDVRMTVDWLEFAVEHLSEFNRHLDANASDHLISKLEQYVSQTTITSTAMQSTLAVLPFQACSKDQRVQMRVAGQFCQTALAATVASLVRHSVHRVVVVTAHKDLSLVQDAIADLATKFSSTSQIVGIATETIHVGKWTHLPKTALVRLHDAWRSQNTTWLGSSPSDIKYIYFTEPDQILNGKLTSASMKSTMNNNLIIVPQG